MKKVYPIIIKETAGDYSVRIPDFGMSTQGMDLADAIFMARDAIGLVGIDLQDDNKELPKPYSIKEEIDEGDIYTLVDVDFSEYRRKYDDKSIKKNCTIPSWLNEEAKNAGINFSKVLQEALIDKLKLD